MRLTKRLFAIAIWLDQGLSAIILGSPDETFSAASYRLAARGSKKWILIRDCIDTIFFWDKQGSKKHCELSYISEGLRKHLPKDYLDN